MSDVLTGLTEGRVVQYVLSSGRNVGQCRPAIVVRNWNQPNGLVQLQVFTDGGNDFDEGQPGYDGLFWATSVHYSENKGLGTWHWPKFVSGASRNGHVSRETLSHQ